MEQSERREEIQNRPGNKRALFEGRVMIHTLEVTDTPRARAEIQARLISTNGELAVLSSENAVIRHLGYLELKTGIARGHHYHKLRHESFYMLTGEVTMLLEELSSGKQEMTQIYAGDLALIQPGIAHAFVPVTPGQAIEYAPEAFDPEDIYRHPIELKD